MNAQRYLNVTDIEHILSWTPKEFELLMQGAKHRQIDQYEYMAKQAMAFGYANRAKRPQERKIFDAKKARKQLNGEQMTQSEIERIKRLQKAFKGFDFKAHFKEKR